MLRLKILCVIPASSISLDKETAVSNFFSSLQLLLIGEQIRQYKAEGFLWSMWLKEATEWSMFLHLLVL
jgi:hypothetical protein